MSFMIGKHADSLILFPLSSDYGGGGSHDTLYVDDLEGNNGLGGYNNGRK